MHICQIPPEKDFHIKILSSTLVYNSLHATQIQPVVENSITHPCLYTWRVSHILYLWYVYVYNF